MKKNKLILKSIAATLLLGIANASLSSIAIAEEVDDEPNTVASVSSSGNSMVFQSLKGDAMIVIVSGENGYNITLGDDGGKVNIPSGDDALPDGSYRFEVRSGGEKYSDKFSVASGSVNY